MDTIKEILHIHGIASVAEMTIDDYIKLDVDGFMPLCIEKVGDSQISVAHYYVQNHDYMRDPEIVFEVLDDGNWVPIEYIQDPFTYEYDENGLIAAMAFAVNTWDKNIQEQGFVEAARAAVSSSPATSQEEVSA
ncbi:DUF6908 domain-containing protein [Halorarum salinum]|uniref:DUF6908 domain-containing protein n=1 Tax=Halorarum salinum TaxID=2743089 RepID=A0A7D5QGH6_9EURY|nr:hypothetical protein [Halobaculum salinum]QLG62062.1 hypothetical protein HUG12_10115 [Halobaculum salinum]